MINGTIYAAETKSHHSDVRTVLRCWSDAQRSGQCHPLNFIGMAFGRQARVCQLRELSSLDDRIRLYNTNNQNFPLKLQEKKPFFYQNQANFYFQTNNQQMLLH